MTSPTPAGEPTDNRRVIRLPHATRLVATLLAAWLVCAAVAFVLVWFSPLNLDHGRLVTCEQYGVVTPAPCPVPNPTPCPSWITPFAGSSLNPYGLPPPAPKTIGFQRVEAPHTAALPILVLRAAALGTILCMGFLGVRAVRSRVRFTVG